MKINARLFTIIAIATISSYLMLQLLIQLLPERQSIVRDAQVSVREKVSEQKEHRNRTLTVRLIGGLGNQLWLYASLYGLAKRTHRQPIACSAYDIHNIFSNLSTVQLHKDEDCLGGSEILNRSVNLFAQLNHLSYDTALPQVLQDASPQHAFLCCYLQNLGYFVDYMDDIRAQLTIQPTLQRRAQDFIRHLLNEVAQNTNTSVGHNQRGEVLLGGESPVLVTVHVRRTNMLKEKTVYQPGPSYFKQAMDIYRHKYGARVVFVVATDDVAWCKKNLQGEDVYFTGHRGIRSREEEFAIAVACNHTVISVGTFGWWLAFVTGGEVVYVQNWVLGSWKPYYLPHQYFPHSWTGLTVNESSVDESSVNESSVDGP